MMPIAAYLFPFSTHLLSPEKQMNDESCFLHKSPCQGTECISQPASFSFFTFGHLLTKSGRKLKPMELRC